MNCAGKCRQSFTKLMFSDKIMVLLESGDDSRWKMQTVLYKTNDFELNHSFD